MRTDRAKSRLAGLWRHWPQVPIALVVLIGGGANLISGTLSLIGRNVPLLAPLNDVGGALTTLGGSSQAILGAATVLVGIGLFWRVRSAWAFALLLSAVTIAVDVSRHQWGPTLLVPALILLSLIAAHGAFSRRTVVGTVLVSVIGILAVLAFGTVGAYVLGNGFTPHIADPATGLFYTITTLATVGSVYQPNQLETKIFETALIVVGLGIFTTAIVSTFGPLLSSELNQLFNPKDHRMPLRDHVVLIGENALAHSIAGELGARNIPFVRVQSSDAAPRADHPAVRGSPCDEGVLRSANVEHARMVVAALDDDNGNAMIALLAKDLNPTVRVLAVASGAAAMRHLKLAGADAVFAPTDAGSRLVANVVEGGTVPAELTDLFAGVTEGRGHTA